MLQECESIARPAVKPLLPNEPRVQDWASEHALTERFLTPAIPCLEAMFLELRARLDRVLCRTLPTKPGKPYPLGKCLEISLAMQRLLQELDPSTLGGMPAQGYAALAAFLNHGGSMRQVWGDLRGEYFQNAFLAGTLYIDVSNDTVVRTKPKVEIRSFTEARFTPVEDYRHFARVASRYWGAHLFPNHVIPSLAPYFPLIAVIPGVGIQFQSVSNYMIALTRAAEFRSGEAVLDVHPMNDELFQLLAHRLTNSSLSVAGDPVQGHALALQYCRKYRAERWHHSDAQRIVAIKAWVEANKHLARLTVQAADTPAGQPCRTVDPAGHQ